VSIGPFTLGSTELVPLAVLMGLATYPFRAAPLLAPGFERLPERVRLYLRLVGPSVLAALAAVDTMVITDPDRHPFFHIGPEWLAVGLCILAVALRRSLLIGLVLAAGSIAVLRALGLATLP
jgi:branched-subunit amino acid transport protein